MIIKLDKKCIICKSSNVVNVISINFDGEQYDIGLCEEHTDKSIKELKDIIIKYNQAVDNLRALSSDLGYIFIRDDINEISNYINSIGYKLIPIDQDNLIVDDPPITNKNIIRDADKPSKSNNLPKDEDSKLLDKPIEDPRQKRQENNNIALLDSKKLQERFEIVKSSMEGELIGTRLIECSNCNGTGFKDGEICEVCNGAGTITVKRLDASSEVPNPTIPINMPPIQPNQPKIRKRPIGY